MRPVAQDLAAYKAYLDEVALEWDDFSAVDKYLRPTYFYRTHLIEQINARELAPNTAKRRMSNVVGLYRFLMTDSRLGFTPANAPWVDKGVGIRYLDSMGFKQVAQVTTTDVSIKAPKRGHAWDATIDDGGKLRPLSVEEQKALIAALKRLDNLVCNLMHLVALFSGAREMTVLTLRVRDFSRPASEVRQWPYKLRCGPGTGVDTKRDIAGVYLTVGRELYEMLHSYAVSEQARRRRSRSRLGEDPFNYLFLTQHGQPYYESKEDRNVLRDDSMHLRRSARDGRRLREFIESAVIPEVRKTLPNFQYRFHDLRATFGMNWVDHATRVDGAEGAEASRSTYLMAREQLRKLMWHKNSRTTDNYLEYRERVHHIERAQADWGSHLIGLLQGL